MVVVVLGIVVMREKIVQAVAKGKEKQSSGMRQVPNRADEARIDGLPSHGGDVRNDDDDAGRPLAVVVINRADCKEGDCQSFHGHVSDTLREGRRRRRRKRKRNLAERRQRRRRAFAPSFRRSSQPQRRTLPQA